MQGISLKQIFKLLIGGNTASNACSMQGDKNVFLNGVGIISIRGQRLMMTIVLTVCTLF